eukprot:1141970-Pelagomonas_calceolata.AAC.12
MPGCIMRRSIRASAWLSAAPGQPCLRWPSYYYPARLTVTARKAECVAAGAWRSKDIQLLNDASAQLSSKHARKSKHACWLLACL